MKQQRAGAALVAFCLATVVLCAPAKDFAEDLAVAKSAVLNFTADTMILEQRVGKFQGLVNGEVTIVLLEVIQNLETLGVDQEALTEVQQQVSTSRREVNARLHVVRVMLGDLTDLLTEVRADLEDDLPAIEAGLAATTNLTVDVERNYEAAETVTSAEVIRVQSAILLAMEGQTGPEVELILGQLNTLQLILDSERLGIELVKSFYDESRVVALEALATVVQNMP